MTILSASTFISLSLCVVGCLPEPESDVGNDAGESTAPAATSEPIDAVAMTALGASPQTAQVLRRMHDPNGTSHVHVRQLVKGVPVWEGEAIVHIAPDGTTQLTDARAPAFDIDPTPAITSARAEEVARIDCSACKAIEATDLWIVRDDRPRLAWRVQLAGTQAGRTVAPIVFVDARDGSVVRSWDNVQTATGNTQYDGTQTIPSFAYNGRYWLEDNTYNLGIYDVAGGKEGDTVAHVASNTNVFPGDYAQAMFSLRNASEYFYTTHGRLNPDGAGGPGVIDSIDHSRSRLAAVINAVLDNGDGTFTGANAAWINHHLLLGKGATGFGDFTSLDMVGHELTHGYIEYTAGLNYSNESGALNESFADVFGSMAERYRKGESSNTWKFGEDIKSGGLRSLASPTSDGISPDHYSIRLIGSPDHGWVHENSGIGNKAFYLAAVGGSHRLGGTMTGIGADRAAKIWFLALTAYMTGGAQFADAKGATQAAAENLYGYHSPEWNAVANAWGLCGVGIVSNDAFANGSFETGDEWALSGTAGIVTGTAQSGSRYLRIGTGTSTSGRATQDFAIDPMAHSATLSYYVQVSSSDTATTANDRMSVDLVDADSGVLLKHAGTWSNLDRGTSAWQSSGVIDVVDLRGRTVRVVISAVNDAVGLTTFRLDNMRFTSAR